MAPDLNGKVCIITGANTGIGKVTAREIASMGAHLFLACRSEEKAMAVVEELKSQTGNTQIEYLELDLSSFESVRACATAFKERNLPLHLLVNNAGVAGYRGTTTEGFELTFGVNHLGHFLLTMELLPLLKASAPARIVNVASMAHYNAKTIDFSILQRKTATTTGLAEYNVSKLANVLFAQELARRLEGTGVTAYSLHPGVVASDVWRNIPFPLDKIFQLVATPFMISNEKGALTSIYCATSDDVASESGKYYDKCKVKEPHKITEDLALATTLWQQSA